MSRHFPQSQNAKNAQTKPTHAQTNPTAETLMKTMFEYERYNHYSELRRRMERTPELTAPVAVCRSAKV